MIWLSWFPGCAWEPMPRGSASRGSELWRQNNSETQFVVCINNEDDPASLEVRKIYRIIPDNRAAEHQFIRVIDESGEDYLYPAAYFVYIELPKAVEAVFA